MPVTDDNYDFLTGAKELVATYTEIQLMVESTVLTFQDTSLNHRIEAKVETKVASLLKTANHVAAKWEKTTVYQADEKVVHQVVAQSAVKKALYINVDSTAESQEFLNTLPPVLPITHHFQYSSPMLWDSMRKLTSLMRLFLWPKCFPCQLRLARHPIVVLDWDIFRTIAVIN